MRATGCSRGDAANRAIEVDSSGRTIVSKGTIEHCEHARNIIAAIGLNVSVKDSKIIAAQEIALDSLRWLVELCGMSDGIRRLLCIVLTDVSESSFADVATEAQTPALDQFLVAFVDQWKEVRDSNPRRTRV